MKSYFSIEYSGSKIELRRWARRVMVTHNEAQAQQTDRIVRFFDGRIIS